VRGYLFAEVPDEMFSDHLSPQEFLLILFFALRIAKILKSQQNLTFQSFFVHLLHFLSIASIPENICKSVYNT